MVTMSELFLLMHEKGASDLHLTAGAPPMLRLDGELAPTPFERLTADACQSLIFSLMTDSQRQRFEATNELDFAFGIKGLGRLRMNVYRQRGVVGTAIRSIPTRYKTFEELNLPPVVYEIMKLSKGLILVTGPTGSGKSTTLASIIQEINMKYPKHILTIEDPVEYVFPQQKALVSQRELGDDTHSWKGALRSALREDPDVVLVGEMRDLETVSAAITVAETGHLVFATLHTNSAAQTIDRIVDVFPSNQQPQIRLQLSMSLEGIVCQKLLPSLSGSRVPAYEVLMASSSIRSIIREGKTFLIDNVIQTSGDQGMISFEACLRDLIKAGKISPQVAEEHSIRPEALLRLLQER